MNRVGAILVGAAIGVGVALLLAPRSGTETRRRLREQADTLATDARGRLVEGRLRATELIRSTQERAQDLLEKGQTQLPEVFARGRKSVEKAGEKGAHRVDVTAEDLEEAGDGGLDLEGR